MNIVPQTGSLLLSDIMTVFNITGETRLSSLVRGGAHIPDIPENANIPTTTSSAISLSGFRGAKKLALQEYPPVALTNYTTTLSGNAHGNGTYTVTMSRDLGHRPAWCAFNKNTSSIWQVTDISGSSTHGDWVQIQLPSAIKLQHVGIQAFTNTVFNRTPTQFTISGIRPGGTELELLGTYSKVANYFEYVIQSPGNTILYDRIRLTITQNTSLANITELQLFATP